MFQVHGVDAAGDVVLRKRLSHGQFLKFMQFVSPCLVGMETCGASHHWARELQNMGHEVRLIPPIYVKPFVKRNKNDGETGPWPRWGRVSPVNDAEAITEAALRPNMSFVAPKSAEQQALAMMMQTREQLLEQRPATVNALRGHLAEFGIIAPVGIKNVAKLRAILTDGNGVPSLVCEMAELHFERIDRLTDEIAALTAKVETHCRGSETAKRLQSMPGIGPIAAMFIEALAPDMAHFDKGRDFAAWLGLVAKRS